MASVCVMNFSVLMSIYSKENPVFFRQALNSILKQTVLPDEIVLVKDGPLPIELEEVIEEYRKIFFMKIVPLEKNMGLGEALRVGVNAASNELIARMDTDDICYLDRFEIQLNYIRKNPDVAVLGSSVQEFGSYPEDLGSFRVLPEKGQALLRYAKYRSPVNHPSIMFRKSAVITSGNYSGTIRLFEDYSLFMRMILKGYKFYNLQRALLHFRVGDGTQNIKRRSGLHYIKSELKFLQYARSIGYLNTREYLLSIIMKTPVRVLPLFIVKFIYFRLLRKKTGL
ncbi:glycosyltransferase [Pedobacter sp. P351]|uniref:glycosyltransferase n=1 Tax=Pedobacter superstes TaxID=3133441 RepID=UPI00309CD8D6